MVVGRDDHAHQLQCWHLPRNEQRYSAGRPYDLPERQVGSVNPTNCSAGYYSPNSGSSAVSSWISMFLCRVHAVSWSR